MTFEDWFKTHDWWKESSAREALKPCWDALGDHGVDPLEIADIFDTVQGVMCQEYGE